MIIQTCYTTDSLRLIIGGQFREWWHSLMGIEPRTVWLWVRHPCVWLTHSTVELLIGSHGPAELTVTTGQPHQSSTYYSMSSALREFVGLARCQRSVSRKLWRWTMRSVEANESAGMGTTSNQIELLWRHLPNFDGPDSQSCNWSDINFSMAIHQPHTHTQRHTHTRQTVEYTITRHEVEYAKRDAIMKHTQVSSQTHTHCVQNVNFWPTYEGLYNHLQVGTVTTWSTLESRNRWGLFFTLSTQAHSHSFPAL